MATNQIGIDMNIKTRPDASPGYWLCTLLPIAFVINMIRHPFTTQNFEYRMMTIAALGFVMESLNFFLYLIYDAGLILKFLYAFLPGITTAILYYYLLNQKIWVCLFWGIGSALLYQYAYIKTLKKLPQCFTFGEAAIIVQGAILFFINAILQVPLFIAEPPEREFEQMNAIMMASLLCLLITIWIISSVQLFRNAYLFYPIIIIMIIIIFLLPITPNYPLIMVLNFITSDWKKIFTIIFYLGLVGLCVCAVIYQIQKNQKASTTVRKIFHIIMVIIFVPGVLLQCTFLYLGTGIALAGLILLEVLRVADVYPFGEYLNQSVKMFLDEKDSGSLALTPIYLLVGCSLPMWIHPHPCNMGDMVQSDNLIGILSGIISIGIGDTVASVFGYRWGKHKWPNSEKSIEGTGASIIFQIIFVSILYALKLVSPTNLGIITTLFAIITVSFIEAFTDQIDNLVLPLGFYIIVNLTQN